MTTVSTEQKFRVYASDYENYIALVNSKNTAEVRLQTATSELNKYHKTPTSICDVIDFLKDTFFTKSEDFYSKTQGKVNCIKSELAQINTSIYEVYNKMVTQQNYVLNMEQTEQLIKEICSEGGKDYDSLSTILSNKLVQYKFTVYVSVDVMDRSVMAFKLQGIKGLAICLKSLETNTYSVLTVQQREPDTSNWIFNGKMLGLNGILINDGVLNIHALENFKLVMKNKLPGYQVEHPKEKANSSSV